MLEIPFLKVIDATYEHDYVLRLTFNTGEVRLCDFLPLSQKDVCRKLQDLEYFKRFSLDSYTINWNKEISFVPEFLFEVSTPIL